MKLYYGGFADYKEFVVADSEEQAVLKVGIKLNAPFLPITVAEIAEVDGFVIKPMTQIELLCFTEKHPATEEKPAEAEESIKTYQCKHADCDFVGHSPIELAQHSRKEHPKGD